MGSTPDPTEVRTLKPLSHEEQLLRTASPCEYPWFTLDGYYRPTGGCRKRCCMVPAVTPEVEDSPKWLATVPGCTEDNNMPFAALGFDDEVVTPFKKHKAPQSGSTPLGKAQSKD